MPHTCISGHALRVLYVGKTVFKCTLYTVNILGSSMLLKHSSTLFKTMDLASNLVLTQSSSKS